MTPKKVQLLIDGAAMLSKDRKMRICATGLPKLLRMAT